MKERLKKVALTLVPILVVYALASTIILGLTFIDWTWVLLYPREAREALLLLNISLLLIGTGLGAWGES
jgi:hypothetical protein